jgi:6-phosphogluconolactonase
MLRYVHGSSRVRTSELIGASSWLEQVLLFGYALRYLQVLFARRRLQQPKRLMDAAPAESLLSAEAPGGRCVAPLARATPIVFAGTGSAIFAFEFHHDGRMVRIGAPVPAGGSPTWLVPDPTFRRLYAVDEASTGGGCASFAIRRDGSPNPLHFLNKVKDPLSPSGPCHCCVDGTGKWLLASNYGHGSICVYEITEMGTLGHVVDTRNFGSETRPSHAHCGAFSPDNGHAFICDLGLDGIHQFQFDERTGRLVENPNEPFVHSSPGSGPRHIAFHPRGNAA